MGYTRFGYTVSKKERKEMEKRNAEIRAEAEAERRHQELLAALKGKK